MDFSASHLIPSFHLAGLFFFFFFLSLVQEKLESIHFETPLLFFTSFTITPSIIYPVTSVIFFFLLLLFFFFFRTLRLFFFFSDFSRIALVVRTHTNYRKGRKKNTFFFLVLFICFLRVHLNSTRSCLVTEGAAVDSVLSICLFLYVP